MKERVLATVLLMTVPSLVSTAALAQQSDGTKQQPANEQVIVPQVDRRDVKLPRFPSRDFEVGAFVGTYATESFGAHAVGGLRIGYHITEDIFVQASIARTRASDELFRDITASAILETDKVTYYNLSAGVNVLPGEVFIGRNLAKPSQLYLIGGVGSTNLNKRRSQTINFGTGLRVFFTDRLAANVEMRDHVFKIDILGQTQAKKSTHNLELTAGLSFFF